MATGVARRDQASLLSIHVDKLSLVERLGRAGGKGWICIREVKLTDWQLVIDFLRRTDAVLYYAVDGVRADLPARVGRLVLSDPANQLLRIALGGVEFTCTLAPPAHIQLFFAARQIDRESHARILLRLLSTLGRTLDKEAALWIREQDTPVLLTSYRPGAGAPRGPGRPTAELRLS